MQYPRPIGIALHNGMLHGQDQVITVASPEFLIIPITTYQVFEFNIWKFRTMDRHTPDLATDIMMKSPRDYTTRVGRFLRRTSLDELPNLINIARGDMSIVGPRPALYNQYELIAMRRQVGADVVRPGLTGWAQINGRDSIDLHEKVRLDEFYVRNCSFLLDLRVLLRTASVMSDPNE